MTLEVSLGLWQDRPPLEVLDTARIADETGYRRIWVGEMATFDAFALGAYLAPRLTGSSLVLGPLAVAVRDPATIAMGAASVAALGGRPVDVALGTSSDVVVEQWHGRSRAGSAGALEESARAVRTLLAGGKGSAAHPAVRTQGYRLRLPAVAGELVVAAFGRGAVRVAAAYADRMVLNLLDPTGVAALVSLLDSESDALGRPRPAVCVWVTAAVGGDLDAAREQLRYGVVGYLAAPGYGEMFTRLGFGSLVTAARSGARPADLLAAVPDALVDAVAAVGDEATVRERLAAYADAGADTVVLVPCSTDADPAGERTLRTLAP